MMHICLFFFFKAITNIRNRNYMADYDFTFDYVMEKAEAGLL